MSVAKLAEILNDAQSASEVQLVDVREDVEARISSLPQFEVKPLSRCVHAYLELAACKKDAPSFRSFRCNLFLLHGFASAYILYCLLEVTFAKCNAMHKYASGLARRAVQGHKSVKMIGCQLSCSQSLVTVVQLLTQLALHNNCVCRMRQWGPVATRELDTAKHTIVMCHHGMRSQQAAEYLQSLGFAQLSNVEGGIHAYSLEVDPSVPVY